MKNNIFRLCMLYTLLFFIASIAMLAVVYITIDKNIKGSIEKEVNAEISRFIGSYQSTQLGIKTEPYAFFIEQNGRKLAGNIDVIPEFENKKVGKKTVANTSKDDYKSAELVQVSANKVLVTDAPSFGDKGKILGKTVKLPGQTTLFIGKNNYDATERRSDILDALFTALMSFVLLGFAGGLLISFQSIRRIDRISRVSQTIMGGNLDLRIPESKQNDDIADLGDNINNMLDRIDHLMQNTREVSNNIAHDLRTPLTRLRASIETVVRKTDGEIQEEAYQALAETDNLLTTFSSLLRISQVESGTAQIHKESVNLTELVSEVMDFYEVLAEEKFQRVRLDLAKNIRITGDKTLLSQAIVNLFTNAVKYTPEKGNITISLTTTAKNQVAQISIHDSGNGVPPKDIPKLTQRFYRLEKHRDTANGNGLGLSMVKAIIEAHNGELYFMNDVGLKVIIELPIQVGKA